ncbi:MAG: hypothetical protein WCE75_02610 [Terracidiphilus sp.]
MHPNFALTVHQILWTLTFAAQLVLLVVLLGRDRVRRYPWFTASIALFALRLLAESLLSGRMAMVPLDETMLTLACTASVVSLLVLVEVARRAFAGARWEALLAGAVALAALAGVTDWFWGPWPQWHEIAPNSLLGVLRLMQLFAQKTDTLADLLTVGLCVFVVLLGRRYHGGWQSHAQKLVIGLSTVSASWLIVQRSWIYVARSAHPQSQAEYERIVSLGSKLVNANKVIYLAALLWWIYWLWQDEPGSAATAVPDEGAGETATGESADA